jgi:hypothetical protein
MPGIICENAGRRLWALASTTAFLVVAARVAERRGRPERNPRGSHMVPSMDMLWAALLTGSAESQGRGTPSDEIREGGHGTGAEPAKKD